ncbi:MAG: caspase family protein [Anaerolineales bacterium]|nr:caspase family protein [Anaerolineales bacterium]MCB9141638.1 caspase family protein [Anaerolineales bacterium]
MNRLALLIAAAHPGDTAMHHDLVAMDEVLRRRGYREDELLRLDGAQTREGLQAFLGRARDRIAGWTEGQIFLHYSGHGAFWPWDAAAAADARPAWQPEPDTLMLPERWVFWDEVFAALAAPPGVDLVVLPDC